MGNKLIIFIFFLGSALSFGSASSLIYGQESHRLLTGKVSYITAQNIYVKFPSTEKIQSGDTVFKRLEGKLIPLFTVDGISSVSCVGKPLGQIEIKIDDEIAVWIPDVSEPITLKPEMVVDLPIVPEIKEATSDTTLTVPGKNRHQDVHGSLSVSSYSNLTNTSAGNSQRMRYNFSIKAANLAKSRFSAESYLSFSHKSKNWAEVQENIFNALKIYSLAVKYDISENANIWAGRRINPQLSNIGAVDGLQAETKIGQFTMGAVAGSRPNDSDYSFNFKLLEYGGFAGHNHVTQTGRMQTSVAFFEQRNTGLTDRRFAYFQHDNSLLKKLYFFTSCELDLYKVVEGKPMNEATLTSLYFSLRYKIFKKLSLFASYDARNNVIYYETYKSYADRLLEEATRQGLQFKINYRPGNQVSMGLNAGYRFREGDLNPNENLNGFVTFNQVPWIKASATISANFLRTSYLSGQIYGIRLSRDIIPGKLFSDFNYRFIDYQFTNADSGFRQNIAQMNLSWQFKSKMYLSVDYELTIEKASNYHRIYLSFSKRF